MNETSGTPSDDEARREWLSEQVAERADGVMAFFGVLFLLLVLGERIVEDSSGWASAFTFLGWMLWSVFVLEFALRLYIAPSTPRFLRKNWWQILFLVVPFLRFLRLFRVMRTGRVLSSAVRGTRTAGGILRTRLSWLIAITVIVIISSSELLLEFGDMDHFGDALHAAAYGAVTGEPIRDPSNFARVLEVVLAAYSVVVFASLAAIVGSFLLRSEDPEDPSLEGPVS